MNQSLLGTGISEGFAKGSAYLFEVLPPQPVLAILKGTEEVTKELDRLRSAFLAAKKEINGLLEKKSAPSMREERQIFEAHLMMLEDPEFIDQIESEIKTNFKSSSLAVKEVGDQFAQVFAQMEDPYMKERSLDVIDISTRLLEIILEYKSPLEQIPKNSILVLQDIIPSMVAQLDYSKVQGIITEIGGTTSHSAILLRNLEIPAVFGLKNALQTIKNGQVLILNGKTGKIELDPDATQLVNFQTDQRKFMTEKEELERILPLPSQTKDGIKIQLMANIAGSNEVPLLKRYQPEGVGLFRTEFLFMDRKSAPTENEQFEIYRSVLTSVAPHKAVIRTLDIGGDKAVTYLNIDKEDNPFLGLRGLRYCLERQDIFRTQIRALLRASIYGNLYVMFPMVTTLDEYHAALVIWKEEKASLEAAKIKFSDSIKLGVMIEVPAAAIQAEDFAKEVDFLSIGSNDLIQYTCAVDRMNPKLKSLYSATNPAVLRLVYSVAKAALAHGKEISVCGEIAGSPELTPFLVACGIRHLSMSPARLLRVKKRILELDVERAKAQLHSKWLKMSSGKEILQSLEQHS